MAEPLISVVVPARDAEALLPYCLGAIAASDLPRSAWELIVVDDASTDSTAAIAAAVADRVIVLQGSPRGPAFARNRGFEAARGGIVAFVDADVCIHEDVLSRFAVLFRDDDSLGAVLGSYDDEPTVPAFVSQYRNLLHHYVHQRNAGYARSFWAGCGAVRRQPFIEAGMFDEMRYGSPQIEDVELGYRMHDKGHRLLLDPAILGKHRKRWTLGGMIRSDFSHRGVPWTHLLLQRGELIGGKSLSVGTADKLSAVMVGALIISLLLLIVFHNILALSATLLCLVALAIVNRELIRWYAGKRGAPFAAGAFVMHIFYHATNVASVAYGTATHFFGNTGPTAKSARQ
ncbi:MAG TPA: glycosyltransferase [Gemmatimonadaceae bacterium]|jgi:glycosyltransferase involved in cell wall biosynthesis